MRIPAKMVEEAGEFVERGLRVAGARYHVLIR
jgi:hypothetical protein